MQYVCLFYEFCYSKRYQQKSVRHSYKVSFDATMSSCKVKDRRSVCSVSSQFVQYEMLFCYYFIILNCLENFFIQVSKFLSQLRA